MAGLLTHLLVSSGLALMVFYLFRNWIYSVAVAIGHLAPDLVDFGITGIKSGSLNPSRIIFDPWFYPLKLFGHNFFNWLIIGLIIFAIVFFFYKLKKLSRKKLVIVTISIALFLVGVLFHLGLDSLIQETNHWI